MSNTADRIMDLVEEALGRRDVTMDDLTSVDKVAVVKKIENEFGVSILNRDDLNIQTMADVVNLIDG